MEILPIDLDNLSCWTREMSSIAEVPFLLFLDCPQEVMLERLLERGKTSGRSDDNIDSIKKRFITYEESTRPIIESFNAQVFSYVLMKYKSYFHCIEF